MLARLFSEALETAIARFLELDPNSAHYLQPMAGKLIELRLTPIDYSLFLCPTHSSLQVLLEVSTHPDAVIIASPLAMARMRLRDNPQRSLFGGEVKIEGDVRVGRQFQALFERLEIDWQAHAGRITGDLIAEQLFDGLRAGRDFVRESSTSLRLNVVEYLQEESRDLPAPAELDDFFGEVDRLRADSDRLEARIVRLLSIQDSDISPES